MHLGLLTYGLDRSPTGIGRYTAELAQALRRADPALDLTLLTAGAPRGMGAINGWRRVPLRGCARLPALLTIGNFMIAWASRRENLDVVHDPTGVTPFLFGASRARTVVTIHDVFAWSYPGTSTVLDTLIYRHWLPRLLPRIDAVVTVSQASRADLVRYLKVPPERVSVVYEGVTGTYRPIPTDQAAADGARQGWPASYMLYVGSAEKRKNVGRLLEACAQLWRSGETRPLVLVGPGRSPELMRVLDRLDIRDRVVFAGYVPEPDLPALYSGADLFVFPSLYEGFGLPPLEAMACGTPVVCSNTSSLPEVVGDAAITVDPRDVEALAKAMRWVLTDADLHAELRTKGLQRAKLFNWDRAAQETIEVYRSVCR